MRHPSGYQSTMTPEEIAQWEEAVKSKTLFNSCPSMRDVVFEACERGELDKYGAQSRLARKLGIHQTTVSYYCRMWRRSK